MKKFISFVMAAAMVASLVPATAFAKGEVTARAKVVDALNITKDEAQSAPAIVDNGTAGTPAVNNPTTKWNNKVPELQLTITDTDYRNTEDDEAKVDVTLTLDNATFAKKNGSATGVTEADLRNLVTIEYDTSNRGSVSERFVRLADDTDPNAVLYNSELGKGKQIAKSVWNSISETAGDNAMTSMVTKFDGTFILKDMNGPLYYDADGDGNGATMVFDANGALDDTVANTMTLLQGYFNGTDTNGQFQTVASVVNPTDVKTVGTDFDIAVKLPVSEITLDKATYTTDFPAITSGTDFIALAETEGFQLGKWDSSNTTASPVGGIDISVKEFDDDEVTYTFRGKFAVDDVIVFDLDSLLDKRGEGRTATVSVESDMVSADDLVYVTIGARGISASTRKTANVAEEEKVKLESDLKIKSTVGDFVTSQVFELKLSKGFEFTKNFVNSSDYRFDNRDGNVIYMEFLGADADEITIDQDALEIEATSAKSGATCTMTVRALKDRDINNDNDPNRASGKTFSASTTVELVKVVDYIVELSVDADEDLPVIYSGVNVANYGITDDSDHLSLEVTAEETFPGAWSFRKGFNFELPEHVYVTDVQVIEVDGFLRTPEGANKAQGEADDVTDEEMLEAFFNAYQEGSHVNFEFEKRVFDDVDSVLSKDVATVTFQLELVADPGFEGDVVLKLTGELVDDQEVTVAKFVKPYEAKAEQNDIIIDYRYTDIPTAITITEAEAGLWAKNEAKFMFSLEKANNSTFMEFEDDPTFEIDSNSDLEIKDEGTDNGVIEFTVKSESDEAATVTIKDMQLFMNRSIPAGPYDLDIESSLSQAYEREVLFAPDYDDEFDNESAADAARVAAARAWTSGDRDDVVSTYEEDTYVADVCDYNNTVKEAFVNVITAGRDVDDASFTTKVVVPVGESYMVAGEKQIELDVPAYINAAGYTMLPIRAVATALGISNSNVLWDQPTKTVTILYGQRIITMTQGQKVVYVNGSAIPASAAVENTNSRTFLPMRDLATALGVTDITWDQATRTATLNGNQK